MGNSFFIRWDDFHGYAVAKHIYHWGAVEVGPCTASGRKVCDWLVPVLRHQSQNCLQVVAPFYRRRAAGIERSFPSTATSTVANASAMGAADCASAQALSPLGASKNPNLLAAPLWAGASDGDHCPMAAALAVGQSPATPTTQSLLAQGATADPGTGSESSLDCGLQGLVSHWQWTTDRTVDRARFVQPVCVGHTLAARPALATGQSRVYAAFQQLWIAPGHSNRQWQPLCLDRAGGTLAFECVVDGFGYPGGVYPAGTSRRKRGTRTDAPNAQEGNHPACDPHPSRAAASHHWLGQRIQSDSSAPGFGTGGAWKLVWQKSTRHAQAGSGLELSGAMGTAASPQQWSNQMARSKTIYWRSICSTTNRSQTDQADRAGRIFWPTFDRPSARRGSWRNASCGLLASGNNIAQTKSVTYVLALKCYPCPDTVPSPALSPRRGRRIGLRAFQGYRASREGLAVNGNCDWLMRLGDHARIAILPAFGGIPGALRGIFRFAAASRTCPAQ
jgi:hypothetical protein